VLQSKIIAVNARWLDGHGTTVLPILRLIARLCKSMIGLSDGNSVLREETFVVVWRA
jgi:hypothetical protein